MTRLSGSGAESVREEEHEQVRRPAAYPWSQQQPISYLELQFYNLRQVQEHAAHLTFFLGQHGSPDADLVTITRATGAG